MLVLTTGGAIQGLDKGIPPLWRDIRRKQVVSDRNLRPPLLIEYLSALRPMGGRRVLPEGHASPAVQTGKHFAHSCNRSAAPPAPKNGRFALFNDLVCPELSDTSGFERKLVAGRISADVKLAIVELGASYTIWRSSAAGSGDATAIEILGGGRYWHQSLGLPLAANNITLARSGGVDWVDPFRGMMWKQPIAPGQSLVVRGDIGGLGVGSNFSWQAMAT